MKKRKIGEIFALDGMKIQVHPRRYLGVRGCKDCIYAHKNTVGELECAFIATQPKERLFVGICDKTHPNDEFTKFVIVGPADGKELECFPKNTDD